MGFVALAFGEEGGFGVGFCGALGHRGGVAIFDCSRERRLNELLEHGFTIDVDVKLSNFVKYRFYVS